MFEEIVKNFLAFCQMTCGQEGCSHFRTQAEAGDGTEMVTVFAQGEKAKELKTLLEDHGF